MPSNMLVCSCPVPVAQDLTREVYRSPEPLRHYTRHDRFMSFYINADVGIIVRVRLCAFVCAFGILITRSFAFGGWLPLGRHGEI